MATHDYTSSVTPQPSGWAKPLPHDERVFMWLVMGSVVVMTAIVLGWLFLGSQNVPSATRATSPAAFAAKVAAFAKQYGGPGGRVYVPPGTDAYMLASRYSWYPELVLESGKKYTIWLSSADALHGFSLVGQNYNLEVAPHHAMGAKITIGKPGRYLIVCNEYCGLGHAEMAGHLDVVPAGTMQAYLATHQAKAATSASAAPAPGALQLTVHGALLAFDKSSLVTHAGKVTLTLMNASPLLHNIALKGNGVDVTGPVVPSGGHSSVTAVLKPGAYTYYCSVPGHEAAGMKGTLEVKP
jgi:cytochrome c oxidase subunit 2